MRGMTNKLMKQLEDQGVFEKIRGGSGKEGQKPAKRNVRTPSGDYRAGIDPEFDYFNPPKMARSMKEGGLVKKDKRDGLAQKGKTKGSMR